MATADYDPRFLQIWRDASISPRRITMADRHSAINLRHRLYRLRKDMEREAHPYYSAAAKVSISVVGKDKEGKEHRFSSKGSFKVDETDLKWFLLLDNADAVFEDSLTKSGYAVPEAPDLGD